MSKKNAFELLMKGSANAAKNRTQSHAQSSANIPSKSPKNIKNDVTFDYLLQFDGGSRGNPGYAGSGSVIYYKGNEIWNRSIYLGDNHTNNYAEYCGLIYGLIGAKELQIKNLQVQGDSKIIINQVNGTFKVNSESLKPLYNTAKQEIKYFENINFQHIYRNMNKRADKLANIAMDKKCN